MNKFILFRSIFVACLFLLFTSCSHLSKLSRAQNAFSKGAEIENQDKFSVAALSSVSSESLYTLAYADLKAALKKKAQLNRDSVYGTALALKALCEWKLDHYNDAIETSKLAAVVLKDYERNGLKLPRDLALMEALEGLIEIDQANDQIYAFWGRPDTTMEEAKKLYIQYIRNEAEEEQANIEKALDIVEKAKMVANKNPEIQLYFVMVQLSGLKVKSDGINLLKQKMDNLLPKGVTPEKKAINNIIMAERKVFRTEKALYLKMLSDLLPGGKIHSVYKYWEQIM